MCLQMQNLNFTAFGHFPALYNDIHCAMCMNGTACLHKNMLIVYILFVCLSFYLLFIFGFDLFSNRFIVV